MDRDVHLLRREPMAVRFGIFVPQGWRLDLVEIRDRVEQFEAMTAWLRLVITAGIDHVILYVARVAYDHRPMQQFAREVIPQFA